MKKVAIAALVLVLFGGIAFGAYSLVDTSLPGHESFKQTTVIYQGEERTVYYSVREREVECGWTGRNEWTILYHLKDEATKNTPFYIFAAWYDVLPGAMPQNFKNRVKGSWIQDIVVSHDFWSGGRIFVDFVKQIEWKEFHNAPGREGCPPRP